MRALLDVNVLIAALLSRSGAPAELLVRWLAGEFELVVTEQLLAELETTLTRPKLRSRFDQDAVDRLLELLRSGLAEHLADPDTPPAQGSRDPDDDYLIAAAAAAHATLVSGDRHLLELEGSIPVLTPRAFLESLE